MTKPMGINKHSSKREVHRHDKEQKDLKQIASFIVTPKLTWYS